MQEFDLLLQEQSYEKKISLCRLQTTTTNHITKCQTQATPHVFVVAEDEAVYEKGLYMSIKCRQIPHHMTIYDNGGGRDVASNGPAVTQPQKF